MYKHTSAERLDSEFTSVFAGLGIQDPAPGGNDYVIKYLGFPLLLLSFSIFSGFPDSGKACSMK